MYMYLFYFLKVDYFKAAVLTFHLGLNYISLVKKNYWVIETIKLFFLFTKQSQIGTFFILLF